MRHIKPDYATTDVYSPTPPRPADSVMANQTDSKSVSLATETALACVAHATQALATYAMLRTSSERIDHAAYPPCLKSYFALAQAQMHLNYLIGRRKGWANFGVAQMSPELQRLLDAEAAIALASTESAYMHFMPRLAGVVAAIVEERTEEARRRVTELVYVIRKLRSFLASPTTEKYYARPYIARARLPMRVPRSKLVSYPGHHVSDQIVGDIIDEGWDD